MSNRLRLTFDVNDASVEKTDSMIRMRGVAATTGIETVRWNMFRLVIAPGAFTKTLQESNVRALWNHNPDFPLASTKSGTLRLKEVGNQLQFEMDINPVGMNESFADAVTRRIVEGMSFGAEIVKEEWTYGKDGEMDLLTLREVKLYEVSPCTFPQFEEDTSIEAVRMAEAVYARAQAGKPTTPRLEPEGAATEPQVMHSEGERRVKYAKARLAIATATMEI